VKRWSCLSSVYWPTEYFLKSRERDRRNSCCQWTEFFVCQAIIDRSKNLRAFNRFSPEFHFLTSLLGGNQRISWDLNRLPFTPTHASGSNRLLITSQRYEWSQEITLLGDDFWVKGAKSSHWTPNEQNIIPNSSLDNAQMFPFCFTFWKCWLLLWLSRS
jgi:hypothetical protein